MPTQIGDRRVAPFAFSHLDSFSGEDIFLPINRDYFVHLLTFVVASHNLTVIVLPDGVGSQIVLLSQLFGKRRQKPSCKCGKVY